MSKAAAVCSSTFGNLGALCEAGNGLAATVGLVLTTDSFEFATATDFADKTKWDEAIKAKQIFPLMGIKETDDNTEEVSYYESPLGDKIKLRDGKYIFTYKFYLALEQHKELQKFSSASLRYFIIDAKNQIRGYSPDGVAIKGYSISTFEAEKMLPATADSPAFSPISIVEQNASQWNGFGAIIAPEWEAQSLASLTNVQLSVVGTPTATSIVLNVGAKIGLAPDGSDALVQITGLDSSDFVIKTATGTAQTVTFVDNNDGTYSGTGTSLATGTADLKEPSQMATTGLLVESTGPVTVTI